MFPNEKETESLTIEKVRNVFDEKRKERNRKKIDNRLKSILNENFNADIFLYKCIFLFLILEHEVFLSV